MADIQTGPNWEAYTPQVPAPPSPLHPSNLSAAWDWMQKWGLLHNPPSEFSWQSFVDAATPIGLGKQILNNLYPPPAPMPEADKQALQQQIIAGLRGPQAPAEAPADWITTYELGPAVPPLELLMNAQAGVAPPPNYMAAAQYLPAAQRIERQVAPAPDYGAADAAMAQAKPGDPAMAPTWSYVLQGLAQGAMGGMRSGGNVGEVLLSMGLGGLGGWANSAQEQAALQRQADRESRAYYGDLAGYEGQKAGVVNRAQQDRYDATYEADSNYLDQQIARGGVLMDLAGKNMSAEQDYNQSLLNASAAMTNSLRDAQLKQWMALQPEVRSAGPQGILLERTNPETGQREMVWDRTNVRDYLMLKGLKGQAGLAQGGDRPEDAFNDMALAFVTNPFYGESLFGSVMKGTAQEGQINWDQMTQDAAQQAATVVGDGNSEYAGKFRENVLFNLIRVNLMEYMKENPEAFMRFAQQNGFLNGGN